MDLYDLASPIENMLAIKADLMREPLGGTIELLPLCNMNCRMCYIRLDKKQMQKKGKMLTCDQWIKIAKEAKERGVLFLLLTGGEPLIYPEFKRLYTTLTDMGFVLTINTNGTLINEEWAGFFGNRPCRRLNITLYGKDNETYKRVCHNPFGFTQVMNAVSFLKKYKVPFRFHCSITPDNLIQLPELYQIARNCEVPLQTCSYMFPPMRKGDYENEFYRITPEQAAETLFTSYKESTQQTQLDAVVKNTLAQLERTYTIKTEGLTCRAGKSGFWINWKGEMLPCGMFEEPKINLLEYSFSDSWDYIVKQSAVLKRCMDCEMCKLKNICKSCAAACLTETGFTNRKPEYLCQMTKACYQKLTKFANEPENE